jgi:hypothetical protein
METDSLKDVVQTFLKFPSIPARQGSLRRKSSGFSGTDKAEGRALEFQAHTLQGVRLTEVEEQLGRPLLLKFVIAKSIRYARCLYASGRPLLDVLVVIRCSQLLP